MNWELVNQIIDARIVYKNGHFTEAAIPDEILLTDEGLMSTEVMNTMNEVWFQHGKRKGIVDRGNSFLDMLAGRYPKVSEDNLDKLGNYFLYSCR